MADKDDDQPAMILDFGRKPPQILLSSSDRPIMDSGLKFPRKCELWFSDQLVGTVRADPVDDRRATAELNRSEPAKSLSTLIKDGIVKRWQPVIAPSEKPVMMISGPDALNTIEPETIDEATTRHLRNHQTSIPVYAATPVDGVSLTPLALGGTLRLHAVAGKPRSGETKAAYALRIYRVVKACEILNSLRPLQALAKGRGLIPKHLKTWDDLSVFLTEMEDIRNAGH